MKRRLISAIIIATLTLTTVTPTMAATTTAAIEDNTTITVGNTTLTLLDTYKEVNNDTQKASIQAITDGRGLDTIEQAAMQPTAEELQGAQHFPDYEAAAVYLKQQALQRQPRTVVIIDQPMSTYDDSTLRNRIFSVMYAHTGVGNEGDYLHHQIANGLYYTWANADGNSTVLVASYVWRTTLAEEAELATMLTDLEANLNWGSVGDDSDIVVPVYKYIMSNMTYDKESADKHTDNRDLTDIISEQSYTAYGAMKRNTAVCQGFAALLYRVLLDKGIDCRILSNGEHVWNAICCDGAWYMADATGDLQGSPRNPKYLLLTKRGMEDMDDSHHFDAEHTLDYDAITAYNWANTNYYSLINMTIKGFKEIVTYTKSGKGKQSFSIINENGKKLVKGKDYKVKQTGSKFGQQTVEIIGLGKYAGESFTKTYEIKLAAPQVKKIERKTYKDKHKIEHVKYIVTLKKEVPNATMYRLYTSFKSEIPYNYYGTAMKKVGKNKYEVDKVVLVQNCTDAFFADKLYVTVASYYSKKDYTAYTTTLGKAYRFKSKKTKVINCK